jgi:hypothetical protein
MPPSAALTDGRRRPTWQVEFAAPHQLSTVGTASRHPRPRSPLQNRLLPRQPSATNARTTLAITDEASPARSTLHPSDPRTAMHQGCVAGANGGEEAAAGGGRHREAGGGQGGLLHPRAGRQPRAVPVRPRRVPRPLVRRRRGLPWLAGRSIAGGVPAHVRGPPPGHRGAAGSSPWPQRRAGLRCGAAPDQERVDPVRPG